MPIKSIRINNYRAFLNVSDAERERYTIDLPEGNNLLVYGENGSGKTSFFNALRDFFYSAAKPDLPFSVNSFYEESQLTDQPSIWIRFLEDAKDHKGYFFSQAINQTDTSECPQLNGDVISGFLSYRDLLKLHFYEPEEEINHFDFFFGKNKMFADEILLTPRKAQNKISFGELWNRIKANGENPDQEDINDFNINAADMIARLQVIVNRLLSFFELRLQLTIVYAEVSPEGSPPKVSFDVNLFSRPVPAHHGILNEARLTSIAISIYLGYLLSLSDAPLKFLFLDDIFIGLDTSNRLPLLKILSAPDLGTSFTFRDFQIFITTYDREWFELAGNYLDKSWKKMELYVDDHSARFERPYIKQTRSYRDKAEACIMVSKDYPAAANYLRKAFESELRRILPANLLYPGIPGGSERIALLTIPKSHFDIRESGEAWLFDTSKRLVDTPLKSSFVSLDALITKFGAFVEQHSIPYKRLSEFQMILKRLLNPLSHDNINAPVFKRELIQGLDLLDDLITLRSDILVDAEKEDPVCLNATDTDYQGIIYTYRIELLENIRYLKYRGFKKIAYGHCHYIGKKASDSPFFPDTTVFPSLFRFCRGVRYNAVAPKDRKGWSYDGNLEFTIFNDQGKSLTNLINEQNL